MRGKKAAQSANRRAGQVLSRAEAAEATLAAERQQWRTQVVALEVELQGLRFEIVQRIEREAAGRISEVAAEAAAQVAEIRANHQRTAEKALRAIWGEVSITVIQKVADILEVSTKGLEDEDYLRRNPGASREECRNLARVSDRRRRTIAKECATDATIGRPVTPPTAYPWGFPGIDAVP